MARGFIVQPTYRVRDGGAVVQLYGRLESGDAFLVEDDRFKPYFFASPAAADAARRAGGRVLASELRDLAARPVVRVEGDLPGAMPALREAVERAGGAAYEADLRFAYRYLIDRGLRATLEIRGRGEPRADGLVLFANPELSAAPAPRVALRSLSLDLETTADASRIFAAAIAGCGVEEVHLVAARAVAGAIVHPEEPALLAALVARIRALDPDVLLGWNVVDFDLRVLLARCAALRIPCALGRSREPPRLLVDQGPFARSRAEVPGRMVLDGIPLVRDALKLPDYRLETVARSVLGRGKKIDQEVPDAAAEILRLWREDPEALAAYNLEDARLVPEILAREGLLELTIERSRLTGMQLDRVGASIASFDLLYLPELRRRGFVAPSVAERENAGVIGGALLEPAPGFHARVAVFDFKSLYPSLIRTFCLDPLAHARAGADAVVAPNGARFSRDESILPALLSELASRRDAAKARGDRHADQAIKILMNAMFGVLGATACRFFDPAVANAITTFGQQTLRWTKEAFEAQGLRVLYGDTDSVFVQLGAAEASGADVEALRARAEHEITSRVRREYGVAPQLVLERDELYDRLWLPRVRGGRAGSKKRYAGWAGGKLHVIGLESVRSDWPPIAQRLQEGMLERAFTDRDPAPFVRELVAAVKRGEHDAELVYSKRVRKGRLDRYSANAPHVQAARKAGGRPGPVIRYVITATGAEPVIPGRALPPRLDHAHYVEKVLRPVAESILEDLGASFSAALGEPQQLPLL
ncbi:MAG TPA: DNA polymerase II [Myxococcota bacterium]